jgi:hypothetical protein
MRSNIHKRIPAHIETSPQEEDENYLPPRKSIHPSERGKWTMIFYRTLLMLFILLLVGLTIWGMRFT